MKSVLTRVLWLPVILYFSLLLYAIFFSEKAIFLPHPSSYPDTPQVIKLKSTDGNRISSLYLSNPAARFTLLVSHGNAEDLGDDREWLESLRQAGFNVFAYDYQGYGTSQGSASESGAYDDENAAYDYLTTQLNTTPDKLIIFGRSVGSGPAVHIAARRPAAALILQSPFLSAFRVVTHLPILPFDRFPNYRDIRRVHCPVLVIHGTKDAVIGSWHGERIYNLANPPKERFWVEGADHNDVDLIAGTRYTQTIKKFADSLPPAASR